MDMDMDKEPVVKFPAGKQPKARCRVIFCDHCGTIMDEPANAGTNVECRMCGHTMPSSVFEQMVIYSLGEVHELDDGSADAGPEKTRQVIKEPCPKCNYPELMFHTMQLRSADEGQTVFYECANCHHTFSTNT